MCQSPTSLFETAQRLALVVIVTSWLCATPTACGNSSRHGTAPADAGSTQPPRLVIHNVSVRSMTGRDAASPQTVYIEGERIARIVPAVDASMLESDRVLDAKGQFLMPGLADMHSHAGSSEEMARHLAYGVTTLRIMQGFETHLTMRDAVASGQRIGPTLIVASPMIDGDPAAYPELVPVRDAAEARERVQSYQRAGFDQIKLYHNLSPAGFFAAIEQAHESGIKAVGHVPVRVAAELAFEAGYASSEHLTGMLAALQREPPAFSEQPSSTEWSLRSAAGADPTRAAALANLAKQHGVWLVPTLRMHRVLQAPPEQWQTWATDPRADQVSNGAQLTWQRELAGRATVDPVLYSLSDKAWQNLMQLTHEIHQAGAELLVGTDYGMPYLFAGEAVHQEIAILVEAGLSAEAALQAATAKPAEFLDQAGKFGTVEVGARADLVVLGADPLLDVGALSQISNVVLRGYWLDRNALDSMLETGALPSPSKAAATPPVCSRRASGSQAMIEDFDDGDAFISGDERRGMWFSFDDNSAGTQTPSEEAWFLASGGLQPGGSTLHVQGGGFTIWGSGVGVSFAWDETAGRACSYDTRAWDGISFWAKGNVSGFTVALAELDVVPLLEGGRCEANCYGSHRATVDLDDCWRQYAFRFEELTPPPWSPETGALNPAELTAIQFYVYSNAATDNRFEYWLDEVRFFKGDKPQGSQACQGGAGGSP